MNNVITISKICPPDPNRKKYEEPIRPPSDETRSLLQWSKKEIEEAQKERAKLKEAC